MKLAKRIVLGVMLLCAAALLAMPARQHEQAPADRTVIRYWGYWSGREADQMQQIIDDFNRTVGAEKKIWVNYISMSQAQQKTLVATAAGAPPDVAGVWGDQIAQYGAMGALEPLEKMAAEKGITKDYYKPVYWDACSYGGHLYALVGTPFTIALYWNKQIFAENADKLRAAGLDPTRPPKTLDELDRYATALEVWSAPKSEGGHLLRVGFLEQQPGWWREHMYDWFGGKIYDEKTGKLTLTDPKVVQAYEWLQSYTKRIGKEELVRFSSGLPNVDTFDTPQNPFLTGSIAMMKQGPWFSNYMEWLKPEMNRWKMSKEAERALPFEQRKQNYVWGVAPFPSASPDLPDAGYAGIDALVIPSTAKHKKEAFEFIAFVNRQDEMEKLCSMHCKNSPLARASENYISNHNNPYIDVFEKLASSPNVHTIPPVPIWPEVLTQLQTISGAVISDDQVSPRELLEAAQKRLEARLEDFNARHEERKEKGLLN